MERVRVRGFLYAAFAIKNSPQIPRGEGTHHHETRANLAVTAILRVQTRTAVENSSGSSSSMGSAISFSWSQSSPIQPRRTLL